MLLGHLAVPTILHHYFELESVPLYGGSIAPDVIDKGLQQVGMTVNGRNWAHNIFSLIISTVTIRLLADEKAAKSWFVGYLGHLLCDADGFVPWFYPFATYEFYPSEKNLWQKIKSARPSIIEFILILSALGIFLFAQKDRKN